MTWTDGPASLAASGLLLCSTCQGMFIELRRAPRQTMGLVTRRAVLESRSVLSCRRPVARHRYLFGLDTSARRAGGMEGLQRIGEPCPSIWVTHA